MKKITQLLITIAMSLLVAMPALASPTSMGALVGDSCDDSGLTQSDSSICGSGKNEGINNLLQNVINTVLMAVGFLAIIMILVSSIKYATSAGDSAKLTSAKQTLTYSIAGLVVASLSFTIANLLMSPTFLK